MGEGRRRGVGELDVSLERARAVRDFLASKGVDVYKMIVAGASYYVDPPGVAAAGARRVEVIGIE